MDTSAAVELQRQGKWAEAAALCRRGLRERPDDDRLLHQLGGISLRLGRVDEALELLRRSVLVAPADPIHRIDLAAILGTAGRPAEALEQLQVALLLEPDVPELHNNRGATLQGLGRLQEAIDAFRIALVLREQYPEARYNLGNALRKTGRIGEAAASFEHALALRPDYLKAAQGLADMAGEMGDLERTLGALRSLCARVPRLAAARSAFLYSIHYSPQFDAEVLAREHREWGRLFCDPIRERIPPHANDCTPERKLRVGYVSPDLREHTVTKFITAPIQHHDPEQCEIFCYSDAERSDHVTERTKGMAERWRETRKLSDAQLDDLIRRDQIDILVDLRGHAADNRLTLFARKPAPVQINMVGYFNTTGLSAMDYRLTDTHMDPPGQTEHLNTEKLVRIEPSCWCYSPEPGAPNVSEPPFLKNGYVTFGSLNKIVKVSEPCARMWAKVLDAVPKSRLLLSVTGDAAPVVRERLVSMGLPVDRLDIPDKAGGSKQYLERFGRIDIALDTFPFNGITTTCDGLWMGVPCVSVAGTTGSRQAGGTGSGSAGASPSLSGTSVSRAGMSILHAANLPDLCADTPDQFVTIATELAGDRDRLRDLRRSMRDRLLASPLMDHPGFARKLGAEYRRMWRTWCSA